MPTIALLALDGVPAPQLSTPALMFGAASRTFYRRPPYELRVCAARDAITTAPPGPFRVTPERGLDGLADAGTVLVTGYGACPDPPPADVLTALRAAADRGARIATIGTGTFALAATGLLDGHRATTDWSRAPELARRHPRIEVELTDWPVADGQFLTSSGVLGGKDVCVRIIEEDHGKEAAQEADRQLFLQLPNPSEALRADADAAAQAGTSTRARAGALAAAQADTPTRARAGTPTSAQADEPPATDTTIPLTTTPLTPTTAWLESNLHRPLTLTDIAAHAHTSVRSLNRSFRVHTGLTPLQYLLRARVRHAQWLLEHTDTPVEQIPARTGLGSPANLRHHFQRLNGTTPLAYRTAFRTLVGLFAPADEPK